MEKLTWRRRMAVAGLVLVGGAALAGCADTGNYDGTGNEFTVRGPVKDVFEDMVEIAADDLVVVDASGRSVEWFQSGYGRELTTGDVRFHTGYRDPRLSHGFLEFCGKEIEVGRVVDTDGSTATMGELNRGDYIEIQGDIRDEKRYAGKSGCVRHGTAVFEEVRILEDN